MSRGGLSQRMLQALRNGAVLRRHALTTRWYLRDGDAVIDSITDSRVRRLLGNCTLLPTDEHGDQLLLHPSYGLMTA